MSIKKQNYSLKTLGFLILSSFLLLNAGLNQDSQSTPGSIICHIRIHSVKLQGLSNGSLQGQFMQDSVYIPLRRAGRLFLIEAVIDGVTGYLVFDTGASWVILNKTYFRNHVVQEQQTSNGINGSLGSDERITIDSLEIAGLNYTGIIAGMTDLRNIENRRGVRVLGLIGFDLLKQFEIILDPAQNQLQLYRIDKKGKRVAHSHNDFVPEIVKKFDFRNNVIIFSARVGGKDLRFCLDTGAETNVIDSHTGKNVLQTISFTNRSTLKGVGQRNSEVLFGKMDKLYIESREFTQMETIIANLDPLSEAYGMKIDGMLGYSFLTKAKFCFNFVSREMKISFTSSNL